MRSPLRPRPAQRRCLDQAPQYPQTVRWSRSRDSQALKGRHKVAPGANPGKRHPKNIGACVSARQLYIRRINYVRDKRSPTPKSETVSRVMSANRAKNSTPEMTLRRALWAAGLRGYRLHYPIRLELRNPQWISPSRRQSWLVGDVTRWSVPGAVAT